MAEGESAPNLCLLDSLYCEEESFGDDDNETVGNEDNSDDHHSLSSLSPPLPSEEELFWEEDDLIDLFSKEKETFPNLQFLLSEESHFSETRKKAIEWMLKVNAYYCFSTLTAILSVNYFDRFLASLHFQRDKPWMAQLAAVACLSLAAKVEETHVPLLLDLQVEETPYIFEAKTIQRMELLVLSTLGWKMNPITPLSFFEHITRRLGFKTHLHWDFFRKCESLLLCFIADGRFVDFLPSVFATAIMLRVINELKPCNPFDHQRQLMGVMNISEDKLSGCLEFIAELCPTDRKRRFQIDGILFNSESSNDFWVSSPGHLLKKSRLDCEPFLMSPIGYQFLNAIASP